jgi:hypothetical protein
MSDLGYYVASALSGGLQGYAKGSKDRRDEEIEKARLRELVNASMMKERESGFRRDGAGAVDLDPDFYTPGTPAYQRAQREAELRSKSSKTGAGDILTFGQIHDMRGLKPGDAVPEHLKDLRVSPSYNLSGAMGRPPQGTTAGFLRSQGHQISADVPDDYVVPTGALAYMNPGTSPPAQKAVDAKNKNLKDAADAAQRERDRKSREDIAKANRDAKKNATKKGAKNTAAQRKATADIITTDVDRVLQMMGESEYAVGPWVGRTKIVPGSPAYDVNNLLDTIRANISFDKLQAMREASPTGGALGQVSDFENRLLQSTLGKLDVTMNPADFEFNLRRLREQYEKIIHEGIATPEGEETPAPALNASQKRAQGAGQKPVEQTKVIGGKTFRRFPQGWKEVK